MAWIVSRTWSCIGEGGSIGGEEGVLGLSDILSSLKIFLFHINHDIFPPYQQVLFSKYH